MSSDLRRLVAGVDLAAFSTALTRRLRESGLEVGLTAAASFTSALAAMVIDSPNDLYWCARLTLVRRHGDLVMFDRVFAGAFATSVAETETRGLTDRRPAAAGALRSHGRSAAVGLPWLTSSGLTAARVIDDESARHDASQPLPSRSPAVADEPFDHLEESDLGLLDEWISTARGTWPTRRSRRMATASHGHQVALRPTLHRSRRTGWEAVRLTTTEPVRRPRRLVMLCDVSRSMAPYAAAYLHLMRATVLGVDSEVFAFATSLTRLTPVLRHRSAEIAIEQATSRVVDRFGGTRIATNLGAVMRSRHGGDLRGAIVVIASDGWDSDPPDDLRRAMARLHRRAHRVVWLNPRAAAQSYRPTVASMAAALPYCDEFLPAATLDDLHTVLTTIADSR